MNAKVQLTVVGILLVTTSGWGATTTTSTTVRPATTTTTTQPAPDLAQLCPCDAPRDASAWKSHGLYVACVRKALSGFKRAKMIDPKSATDALRAARQATCGSRPRQTRAGQIRCCVKVVKVSPQPFCSAVSKRSCRLRHGTDIGAGSCTPNPCH